MRLGADDCWERLGASGHGVLGTVHAARGVDTVPVVFVVEDRQIVIPIDTVKPKRSARLQRLTNLEVDDRCVLLVDHYDDDWSKLWWVRVHGRGAEQAATAYVEVLARAFPAYDAPGAVASAIVIAADELTGWTAESDAG